MKSVGEAMAIGRTFRSALLKGLQSLELNRPPFPTPEAAVWDGRLESLGEPRAERVWAVWEALRHGHTVDEVAAASRFDRWFVDEMREIVLLETRVREGCPLVEAKREGMGDRHLAWLLKKTPFEVREARPAATFHVVDTCAAEFLSNTPYLYSGYESETEMPPSDRQKVIILGSGPNRIGQGIEFDYCCVHAAQAVRKAGLEAVMINCNPETVSTDYDTSDRLYFEPLTPEHVLNIVEREQPLLGVVVQFGGQTPLNMVHVLAERGVPILGTGPEAIDLAEDRGRFGALLDELDIPRPACGMAGSLEEARRVAEEVGYPVLVRPSYVLGGRAMVIVYDGDTLAKYMGDALAASSDQKVLIDHYLEDAFEADVDAVCDGERVVIGGIMQHIEEAGIHSGDSACVLPPYKISSYHLAHIREYTERLGLALGVRGLMNVQYAIQDDVVYVLEVNPRASRTVPYVSKATGVPLARLATQVVLGAKLAQLGFVEEPTVKGFFVKEAVLPFKKFLGFDVLLGPEMRSTGEVMGHAVQFGHAFAKAQLAAGDRMPLEGTVFLSVNDFDKSSALKLARELHRMGFKLMGTKGTAEFCSRARVPVETVHKVGKGSPNVVDLIVRGDIQLIINTPLGSMAHGDGTVIRTTAIRYDVPLLTTLSAAQAAVKGIQAVKAHELDVLSLQQHYAATH
jgi:carbamoyl-phosphate synthase large subunit